MKSKKLFLTVCICTFCFSLSSGQNVELEEAFPGTVVTQVLGLETPGNDSPYLYALSQQGQIYRLDTREPEAEAVIWLDISGRTEGTGERGLLGLAFHPDFFENGRIYINYTSPDPLRTRVSRFSADEDEADPDSEEIILEFDQPQTNHNGGQARFGPDGYLYISSGDGGGAGDPGNNAQDAQNLLGAMLRIDVDNQDESLEYAIPEDNPFLGSEDGLNEIFAWGLRNPWRFSFDLETGVLWAADVGQSAWEAIHIVEAGNNYGWSIIEGSHCYPPGTTCDTTGLEMPVFEYSHDEGRRSVTGGYVYRGSLNPSLEGLYIYGDFVSGHLWALDYDMEEEEVISNTELAGTGHNISSFGQDGDGELYVLAYESGEIFRLLVDPVFAERDKEIAYGYDLEQNYPNPFNPSTVIAFELPGPSQVLLEIYDLTGRHVTTLVDGSMSSGRHEVTLGASGLSGGFYLYRLKTGDYMKTKKMLLIK